MYTRLGNSRSTETPMDFEFTSRPNIKPPWAAREDEQTDSRKRTLSEMNTPSLSSNTPTFSRVQNVPFMFPMPQPQTELLHPWVPPSSPFTAKLSSREELRDVDMAEPSPPRPHKVEMDKEMDKEQRLISVGGLKRVFRSRQKAKGLSKLPVAKTEAETDEDENTEIEDDVEGPISPTTQNTSNHYTLNLPGPTASPSDTPYVLLGYLQFFFNLSLILVFLYLLLQFILTVQRDVEHKVSEYSMEIVQEIAQCTLHYNTNLCATNPIPAMTRQCGAWETCMNRDPSKVGRARVGAELIAEVVNGFVEPISWKTLAFTLTSLSFFTVFINSLLSLYRSRHSPTSAVDHQHPAYPQPPAPYSHHMPQAPPVRGKPWSKGSEIEETPRRRRRLESGAAKEAK